jgi:hypothetical protein
MNCRTRPRVTYGILQIGVDIIIQCKLHTIFVSRDQILLIDLVQSISESNLGTVQETKHRSQNIYSRHEQKQILWSCL